MVEYVYGDSKVDSEFFMSGAMSKIDKVGETQSPSNKLKILHSGRYTSISFEEEFDGSKEHLFASKKFNELNLLVNELSIKKKLRQ